LRIEIRKLAIVFRNERHFVVHVNKRPAAG
jgi:hypothetical protein